MDRRRVRVISLVSSLLFLVLSSQASIRLEDLKARYDPLIKNRPPSTDYRLTWFMPSSKSSPIIINLPCLIREHWD